MEAPIGFAPLLEATDLVGRKVYGPNWHPIGKIDAVVIMGAENPAIERVIAMIAGWCEAGELPAVFRSLTGTEDLDPRVWQVISWRNYFTTGTIDWLDANGHPNTKGLRAIYPREIFVRQQNLERLVATLPWPALVHTNLRYPSDEPLIREALQALVDRKAKNPSQAAKLVYLKAQGPTPETNLDRLRKLIAFEWSEWKASPKIANSSPNT
jgi:hypothetical protein